MTAVLNLLPTALALLTLAGGWQTAKPGWEYEFPRDHHAHLKFKTEWWYFTGNLTNQSGRRFGYELTFFRQGIRPPEERMEATSRMIVDDLKFAHFTITDAAGKKFVFYDKASRGSFGEAGFDADDRLAWIDRWAAEMKTDGTFNLSADAAEGKIRLHLVPTKQPVIHGRDGVSRKAAGNDHASHYYSITRLTTTGNLQVQGNDFVVRGDSWFDHEWATNQLASDQAGWNWVSAQFDDGSELMLYEMRLTNERIDPASSGTFVEKDGTAWPLESTEFQMNPKSFWVSPRTKARYPIGWEIIVPKLNLHFEVQPVLPDQELAFTPLTYWEGAFDLRGTQGNRPVKGQGYLELTGYAAPLQELNR